MPRNGSGVYSLPAGSEGVSGTTIQSSKYNAAINDIASALTDSLPRNGSAAMTAALPMGGFKISGLAAGAASGEAVEYAQMNTAISNAIAGTVTQPIKQTVLSGPVNSNGSSNFGGSTGSTTVTVSGTLLVHAAGGISVTANVDRLGSSTNPSWTALSTNGTMYLYLQVASDGTCTTGSTTLAPIYQYGGSASVSNGQHTFLISEMKMYVGDGTAASQVYRVFIGQVTVSSSVVSAISWYTMKIDVEPNKIKAFVNFVGASVSISSSFNISSVTRSSTGSYTVNFKTPMQNDKYIVSLSGHTASGTLVSVIAAGSTPSINSFDINTYRAESGTSTDPVSVRVMVVG